MKKSRVEVMVMVQKSASLQVNLSLTSCQSNLSDRLLRHHIEKGSRVWTGVSYQPLIWAFLLHCKKVKLIQVNQIWIYLWIQICRWKSWFSVSSWDLHLSVFSKLVIAHELDITLDPEMNISRGKEQTNPEIIMKYVEKIFCLTIYVWANGLYIIYLSKHRKNCECCPVSQLIVR